MMKTSTAALAAILLVGLAAPASARAKPALPLGEWGREHNGKPNCDRPFLKIEPNYITQQFDVGKGRCKVTSLKDKGKWLDGKFDCKWDASVPPEYQEGPDDDGTEFSVVIQSPTRILYNNNKFGLCPAKVTP